MQKQEEMPRLKSMFEKLQEGYRRSDSQGNSGHVIGFYRQNGEEVKAMYRFQKGLYTLRSMQGDFFWWDYQVPFNNKPTRNNAHKSRR